MDLLPAVAKTLLGGVLVVAFALLARTPPRGLVRGLPGPARLPDVFGAISGRRRRPLPAGLGARRHEDEPR